jgi:hypothetical protein
MSSANLGDICEVCEREFENSPRTRRTVTYAIDRGLILKPPSHHFRHTFPNVVYQGKFLELYFFYQGIIQL